MEREKLNTINDLFSHFLGKFNHGKRANLTSASGVMIFKNSTVNTLISGPHSFSKVDTKQSSKSL